MKVSVILNAPAVFEWTACACPDRHLQAANVMGANTDNVQDADAGRMLLLMFTKPSVGKVLVEKIVELMSALNIPNGLSAIGYTESDIPRLVEGILLP